MSRPTVAVYTPILNEALHIERWAASAAQADLLLMLDTGSTDASVALARSCGIDIHTAYFPKFRFDDARNTALALIPMSIDIVIQLDADEVLEPGWRDAIDAVEPHDSRWWYTLRPGNSASWGSQRRSNCHRRRASYRWMHPIHEVIAGPQATATLDLTITHLPDIGKSRDHYLPMLAEAVMEEPFNARMRYYLGREQWYRGAWNAARETLYHYLSMPTATWAPERSEAYLMIAMMDHDPLPWFAKSIAECPDRREPYAMVARWLAGQGRLDEARSWAGIASLRTDRTLFTTRADCWDDLWAIFLREIG
jgi:glycosyltransferase involved in cell wall biosynthesis